MCAHIIEVIDILRLWSACQQPINIYAKCSMHTRILSTEFQRYAEKDHQPS